MSQDHISDKINGMGTAGTTSGTPGQQNDELLRRYQTSHSVVIPREVFEELYLEPTARRKGSRLGTIFGNPTPMPLMGFLIASMPLGCNLMGWRGSGGGGAAIVGLFYFFGGMLQIIGSVLEWILGNTFTYIVFACYGAFWLALSVTLTPFYNAQAFYDTQSGGSAEFAASFAFFHMCMALVTFFFVVCSIRTNVILWLVFVFIDLAFIMLMAVYWTTAEGMTEISNHLQTAAGAFVFVFCVLGWYLFFHLILLAVDLPTIPVWDLSNKIPGQSERKKKTEEHTA